MTETPPIHEAADLFPLEEETLDALAADIRERGQAKDIELYEGKVLDGRRRLRACNLAGVAPRFRDVTAEVAEPVAYVLSLNLHRRQLTPSQKAIVAARVREMYDRAAKERQKSHAGTAPGKRKTLVENVPQVKEGTKSRDAAGKAVGVNGKYVDHATKVLANAVPEVVKAVEDGRMNVTTAALLATEAPEVQREEATKPKRNRKYTPTQNAGAIKPAPEATQPAAPEPQQQSKGRPEKVPDGFLGVGVIRAHEAINILSRIPRNDALRKDGFKLVKDWLRREEL
jgi:ParB-like chromosome segregation protein Spo0J